jgi:hypothetical protein
MYAAGIVHTMYSTISCGSRVLWDRWCNSHAVTTTYALGGHEERENCEHLLSRKMSYVSRYSPHSVLQEISHTK